MHDLDDPANGAMISASNFVKIFPLWHLAEFAAGVALCVGMRSRLHLLQNLGGWLMLAGLVQILSSVFIPPIFSQGTYCLPGFVLIVLGAAATPFPDLASARPATRRLASGAVLLGNVSYAVYLFHVPVIFYLGFINRHVHPIFPTGEAGVWSLYVSTVVLSTLIGLPLYWFYETPARIWCLQWLRKHWVEAPGEIGGAARPSRAA
jgi:peptidoglycan/LPS O-acetylase OafA/YrhL